MRAPASTLRALTHPLVWAAAGLVLLNDFGLRAIAPGWWSGKLSDVGWLVLAPVLAAAVLGGFGVAERWARALALAAAAGVYTTLQLWPPLGAWFSPAHVADAQDLIALPALLAAWWVWRTPGIAWQVPPAVGGAFVVGTLVADEWISPHEATWPCAATPTWDAATPLRVSVNDLQAPVGGDAFLRGLSLVDEAGNAVPLVVADDGGGEAIVCARDGLVAKTAYTWTVGPWDEPASNEVEFSHAAFPTVQFVTGETNGEPAPTAAACEDLDRTHPLVTDLDQACDPGAMVEDGLGDSGDSGAS